MSKSKWRRSSSPEYRNPVWKRENYLRGGSVQLHFDAWGRREFVRRNWLGDVTLHRHEEW